MNDIFYGIMKMHAPALFEDKAEMVCQWELDERDGGLTRWCVTHDSAHLDDDTDIVEEPLEDEFGFCHSDCNKGYCALHGKAL